VILLSITILVLTGSRPFNAIDFVVYGVVMRNTIAYPTQQSSSPFRGIPCSHKRVTAV